MHPAGHRQPGIPGTARIVHHDELHLVTVRAHVVGECERQHAALRQSEEDVRTGGLNLEHLRGIVRDHLLDGLVWKLRAEVSDRLDAVHGMVRAQPLREPLVDENVAHRGVHAEDRLSARRAGESDDALPLVGRLRCAENLRERGNGVAPKYRGERD